VIEPARRSGISSTTSVMSHCSVVRNPDAQLLSISVDGWCDGSASALATLSGDIRETDVERGPEDRALTNAGRISLYVELAVGFGGGMASWHLGVGKNG